jgi:hypothetical protein
MILVELLGALISIVTLALLANTALVVMSDSNEIERDAAGLLVLDFVRSIFSISSRQDASRATILPGTDPEDKAHDGASANPKAHPNDRHVTQRSSRPRAPIH